MMPENIGQHIRQARKAKGITQDQLASLMYVSRQTVSSWENARTQPDYETLQKLASLLDINLAQVFGAAETEEDGASDTDSAQEDPDSSNSAPRHLQAYAATKTLSSPPPFAWSCSPRSRGAGCMRSLPPHAPLRSFCLPVSMGVFPPEMRTIRPSSSCRYRRR